MTLPFCFGLLPSTSLGFATDVPSLNEFSKLVEYMGSPATLLGLLTSTTTGLPPSPPLASSYLLFFLVLDSSAYYYFSLYFRFWALSFAFWSPPRLSVIRIYSSTIVCGLIRLTEQDSCSAIIAVEPALELLWRDETWLKVIESASMVWLRMR